MYSKRNKNIRIVKINSFIDKTKSNLYGSREVDTILRLFITIIWCTSYIYINNEITIGCIISTLIINVGIRLLQENFYTKGK